MLGVLRLSHELSVLRLLPVVGFLRALRLRGNRWRLRVLAMQVAAATPAHSPRPHWGAAIPAVLVSGGIGVVAGSNGAVASVLGCAILAALAQQTLP